MGKNAQKRRGDTQPQIHHFTMSGDAYIAIRRYLGSKPHDECRELIMHLEAMPAITADDIELREKQNLRLAELEAAVIDAEDLFPDGDPDLNGPGAEEIGKIVELTPDQEAELDATVEDLASIDSDVPVATDPEEE